MRGCMDSLTEYRPSTFEAGDPLFIFMMMPSSNHRSSWEISATLYFRLAANSSQYLANYDLF